MLVFSLWLVLEIAMERREREREREGERQRKFEANFSPCSLY
jgi:hypothetical protein